ncbi:MAG TPA: tRNA pseudouridine(55) synthase TruB [Polyangia bacterium]|jgi:tRNA pseudouridine55 synthase|nr:tRNA pseudouridine(55) synthase TruB [Polyangia bacterium]
MTPRLTDGVLVVDKPSGPTSFDVVRRIKRAAHLGRVGHGGTLDPLASGVLPICVGEGTKLAAFLLDADKEYDFTLRLGVETDTYDAQGTVTARHDPSALEEVHVRGALAVFTGRIEQTPPIYSALKRAGRPLYAYARAGDTVEIAPRAVTVRELTLTSFEGPGAVGLRVRCSKGTYVRSLAFDLGRRLGVGAHVTALRRTRCGPFALAASIPLDAVLDALADVSCGPLPVIAPADALPHLPRCSVDVAATRLLEQGKRLPWGALEGAPPVTAPEAPRVRVLRPDGRLLAVAEPRADGTVKTLRVFGVAEPTKSAESAGIR